jgi:TnpA family transposase
MPKSKRITILNESEVQNLYSVPAFTAEQQRYFFILNDYEKLQINQLKERKYRCAAIALLGYFKSKPIQLTPSFTSIYDDLKYIANNYYPGFKVPRFSIKSDQRSRLYKKVLELVDYTPWRGHIHEQELGQHLLKSAQSWQNSRSLFDSAIEYLSSQKIVVPAYSLLQKIISQVVNQEQNRLIDQINQTTSKSLKQTIADMASSKGGLSLGQIRQSAKSFNSTELDKELTVYRHIKPLMSEVNATLDSLALSQKNLQHFADRVDYYGAKLKRQSQSNQRLYLLCYLQKRWQQSLERIAEGFIHHLRQVKQKAKAYAQVSVYKDWQKAAKNVSKAAEVLHLFIDDKIDHQQLFGHVRKQALNLIEAKELESVCLFLNDQKRSVDEAMWQYFDQRESLRTGLLRELFKCLRFDGSEGSQRLALALNQVRLDLQNNNKLSAAAIDGRLPSKNQLPFLLDECTAINLGRYEWYLYLQIPSRLNGQLTLPEVFKYRALDADLVDRTRWLKEKVPLLKQSQLPKLMTDPHQLIEKLALELDNRLHDVSDYLEHTDNRNIILRNPKGKHLWRFPAASKKYVVNNPFFQQIPSTGVADMLRMVDKNTGFLDCFEHVLGTQSKSRAHEYDLLAILVGNATNQGIYGISQISDRTYDQLSTIQANYLRLQTLNTANDCINNATAKLPIFKHYNIQEDLIHASADGQKFEARRETFKTRYSSKYFGTQKGVSAISLIANHAAINARVIGANEHESHYIFDLLMNNNSEIIPDVLSTDTHGVNHVNFALLDLFGYQFAPRYAQVGKVINELFDVTEDKHQHVQLRLKKPINTKRITQYWDTIQRIAVSLKERKTTQATLVRKLSGYKKNHPLLEALTEYNRMIKASYLLNYIDDASLRSYVQRALNRGEAYHQLRRAISNVNGDQFRGSSDEEILLWNECARLVTNAIIYFNSYILSRLLTSFEYQKDDKKIAIVKQASPVAWYNINLKGTYNFELNEKLPDLDEMMQSIEGYLPIKK